ncbi:pre-mRNA-splicing factor CWC25 [Cyclospora cayetanensis]|uniref:Pre-mRNA-splicing factor CWC25 n=1 Tax=Cyclospora cayetanensis TaxID=88456 RepID=A0A6P6RZ28_9EIME|nr:pre-mRNA-splicing factor CWC25 [Cyclospora cayetanensis]
MLPFQLRKAVDAANQTAQQQLQQREPDGGMSTQEYSRLAELQKQRAHLEMRQLQAQAGLLTRTQAQVAAAGLEWLYDDPKNSAEAKDREREAYLLGKPLPDAAPKADESLEKRVAESATKAPPRLLPTQDCMRKLREDPLLLIRQAELAQQQVQESNPLLQLQQMRTQATSAGARVKHQDPKKEAKKKKHKHKKRHKHGKRKRSRSSDSSSSRSTESEREQRDARYGGRREREAKTCKGEAPRCETHSRKERSRSRDGGRHSSALRSSRDAIGEEHTAGRRRHNSSRSSSTYRRPSSPTRRRKEGESREGEQRQCSNYGRALTPQTFSDAASSSSVPSRTYGPTMVGAGSEPAPFRVSDELLPPLAIRQKAMALEEAKRNKSAIREAVQGEMKTAGYQRDSDERGKSAEQLLEEMRAEGLRREAEKERRSELVRMKDQLEARIEAQRRALLDSSDETRGLRPSVVAASAVEPSRDAAMKYRRMQKAIHDLGASNKELNKEAVAKRLDGI